MLASQKVLCVQRRGSHWMVARGSAGGGIERGDSVEGIGQHGLRN